MKKILAYIVIAFLSALVIGSIYISTTRQNEPLTEGSPERTVQIYIDNILNDRSIEAYELIAKELRDNCRYSEFINTSSLSYDPYEVETITLVKSEIIKISTNWVAMIPYGMNCLQNGATTMIILLKTLLALGGSWREKGKTLA